MSRVRRTNQTVLNKLLKDISRRMEDFELAVEKLKELKDSAVELDDTIAEQAANNKSEMEKLNKDLEDNKLRTINQAVSSIGKVVISREELQDLRDELAKVKANSKKEIESKILLEEEQYQEKLKQELSVQNLKHEVETAKLHASVESHEKEVENLNAALDRMAEELKSQKELTASIVKPRPQQNEK